ncbi:hypothetical protein GCM10022286_05720 [Gryllotalpicola daejeonensis]|uniref:Uncharacterized protein n=1 Tax=Gryllotalpicola daejeonensis TaxID=993087 RepID=A0ABP7ZG87_9MICO
MAAHHALGNGCSGTSYVRLSRFESEQGLNRQNGPGQRFDNVTGAVPHKEGIHERI